MSGQSDKDTNKSSAELEQDIEHTRAQISEEVDALGHKLSPAGLGESAKDTLKDTQGVAFKAIEGVSSKVLEKTGSVGGKVVDLIKQYPLPVTLVGLGVAWLLIRGRDETP